MRSHLGKHLPVLVLKSRWPLVESSWWYWLLSCPSSRQFIKEVGQRCRHRLFYVPWGKSCNPGVLASLVGVVVAHCLKSYRAVRRPTVLGYRHVLADSSYSLMTERSLLIIVVLNLLAFGWLSCSPSALSNRAFNNFWFLTHN